MICKKWRKAKNAFSIINDNREQAPRQAFFTYLLKTIGSIKIYQYFLNSKVVSFTVSNIMESFKVGFERKIISEVTRSLKWKLVINFWKGNGICSGWYNWTKLVRMATTLPRIIKFNLGGYAFEQCAYSWKKRSTALNCQPAKLHFSM